MRTLSSITLVLMVGLTLQSCLSAINYDLGYTPSKPNFKLVKKYNFENDSISIDTNSIYSDKNDGIYFRFLSDGGCFLGHTTPKDDNEALKQYQEGRLGMDSITYERANTVPVGIVGYYRITPEGKLLIELFKKSYGYDYITLYCNCTDSGFDIINIKKSYKTLGLYNEEYKFANHLKSSFKKVQAKDLKGSMGKNEFDYKKSFW